MMNENDPDALVTVFRTNDSFTGGLIQSQLESEGIDCRLGGATQAYLPCVGTIEVLIRQRDVARALPMLREFENRPPPDPGVEDEEAG
jgi:hypothetical protein